MPRPSTCTASLHRPASLYHSVSDRTRRVTFPQWTEGPDSLGRSGEVEDLARVEDAEGIEGGLDGAVDVHRDRSRLAREPLPLEDADAVLPGDRAAEREPDVHDLAEGHAGVLGRGGIRRIEDDDRMHVAVAGVTDDADDEAVGGRDLLHRLDQVGEP